ncbi:MAG: ABC transporter ATP-binding protein [Alphaproteobacteria bacterium]
MNPTLEIDGLHLDIAARDRRVAVLRGVDLAVAAGEVHGLVGESGAGKTMVGRAVLGLAPESAAVSGRIRFAGGDLLGLPERARRALLGRGMALIPQDPLAALNPVRRIGAQIADMLRLHLRLGRRAAAARVLELLGDVHIRAPERVVRQYPHELSGGMRQRVLIAIAFSCRPRLIVADEPTTALDVTVQRRILRLIRELNAGSDTAILFITHDLGVVAKICDRVSVIHAGRIVEAAPVGEIFAAPRHDYTRALLRATPRHDRPANALAPIPAALAARLADEAAAFDRRRAEAAADG